MQKDRAQKRRDLKGRIMLIHIKNENESAAIDTLGAELVSFMGDDGFEHIWQGDKTYWGGHAPVLFPIVGALRDNRTCINGEWYEMKRHGVARHEEFTVTEQGEDYVTLQLTANEETKKQYPFDFVLTVSYYLTGSSITTKFTVKMPILSPCRSASAVTRALISRFSPMKFLKITTSCSRKRKSRNARRSIWKAA